MYANSCLIKDTQTSLSPNGFASFFVGAVGSEQCSSSFYVQFVSPAGTDSPAENGLVSEISFVLDCRPISSPK